MLSTDPDYNAYRHKYDRARKVNAAISTTRIKGWLYLWLSTIQVPGPDAAVAFGTIDALTDILIERGYMEDVNKLW